MARDSDDRTGSFPRGVKHSARDLRAAPTPAEKLLWKYLRDRHAGGFKFRRQQRLGRFYADFFCAEAKLVVEIDGTAHEDRAEADEARTTWMRDGMLEVIRFTNEEVEEATNSVIDRIIKKCTERTSGPRQAGPRS